MIGRVGACDNELSGKVFGKRRLRGDIGFEIGCFLCVAARSDPGEPVQAPGRKAGIVPASSRRLASEARRRRRRSRRRCQIGG